MRNPTTPDLARRDLLRRLGVGAACLPLLGARRAFAAAAPARKRLLIVQMTEGYRQLYWKPAAGALANQSLPSTNEPFEPWKSDLVFLPGLSNTGVGLNRRDAHRLMFYGFPGSGAVGAKQPAGPTLDQVVAAALPRPSGARASLNLGVMVERPPGSARPEENACFWTNAGAPIRALGDPYAVYRDLFIPAADDLTVKRLILRRRSILDYVGSNLEEFGKRAGTEDRFQIEAHRQSIRDLEGQLQALGDAGRCGLSPPSPAVDLNADASYPIVLDLHFKAMVAALRCGVTSVATLQLSDAAATAVNLNAFIPLRTASGYKSNVVTWRDLGHDPVYDGVDRKRLVERWFMERLAGLLGACRAVIEDGVPMLDNMVVLIGNSMEDGVSANGQRIPWMLAGKAGGALATGQCLPGEGRPITSVMAGICEALGAAQHPYGPALPGLKKI